MQQTFSIRDLPAGVDGRLDALLDQGPLLIEWPERIDPILPSERLWTWLEYETEEHRGMRFAAHGRRYEQLLEGLRQAVYGAN